MKTLESHSTQNRGRTPRESGAGKNPDTIIDTSKMSAGQRAALEMTEAAREDGSASDFAGGLFQGNADFTKVIPFPEQSATDLDQGDAFLQRLESFLRERVDPDEIDETGEIPEEVIRGLADLGAFGIKVEPRHGGLGLSQTNYCRAAALLGSYCGNIAALVSAHQSIGVPQPLILFGTESQKRRFLPRVARGEISAFALTEAAVGSDPAKMRTEATPTQDGRHFVLNGEKLWCTNGVKAGVMVVMAKTPEKVVEGRSKKQITAFVVDVATPGVEVAQRCRFMGLKALYNGVIRFRNARVPCENVLLGEGKGLKVALSTLNTGRLTLSAACTGVAKRCLRISREWASSREQWGAPIGRHAAIADKIATMAADVFAMESMTLLAASRVDQDKRADVRMEAAMCKLWATERAWKIVDDAMQIRGGRGYETAASLKARGEEAIPVERFMRDCRINTIFEGSSEIMRLFIAREALNPHLRIGAPVLDSRLPLGARLRAALRAAWHYAGWYPLRWLPDWALPTRGGVRADMPRVIRGEFHFIRRAERRLARALLHAMAIHGPALEKRQMLLGRLVDIGTELFAMTASCSRAASLMRRQEAEESAELLALVSTFCRQARLRVEEAFRRLHRNSDAPNESLARSVLEGDHDWLETGIIGRPGVSNSQIP